MLGIAVIAAPTAARASQGGCTSSSPCSLVFTADGQPAGTTINTSISSSFDSPNAGPVKVQVVDQFGATVTNSKAAISIAITTNPGAGTLAGKKTVNAVGGVASFSGLSINQPGIGYRLTATANGMGSVTSNYFDIWTSVQQCSPPTPCSTTASSTSTSGTVTTSSADQTQFVGAGIGSGAYDCGPSYPLSSDQFSFDVVNSSGGMGQNGQFTAVLRIQKPTVQSSGHPGASTWQICYAALQQSPTPSWATGTATIGDVHYDTGLLPDCSNTAPAPPCVQSRTKDNAGDVLVTFLASGDPLGRG